MKYLKDIRKESRDLEVFEAERLLKGFLADKGIKADIQKFDQYFNIFISSYANEEGPKRVPVKKLLDYFKSLELSEDAQISKTKFGYTIEMLSDAGDAKLMEATEEEVIKECCICENFYHGLGHDPWPVFTKPEERCCNECKNEFVMPARRELLNEKTKTEATDKTDVEHAASNTVLDNKFIWLFNVLDSNGEDIEEGIEYLQDAIDILVDNNGTFLVAFPYIDPKPGDNSVELVFADNPGPVVIYNKEEVTVSKGTLEKPTSTKQPKRKEATEQKDIKAEALVSNEQTDAVMSVNLLYNYIIKRDSIIEEIYGKQGVDKLTDYLRQMSQVINRIGRLSEKLSDSGKNIEDLPWSEASKIPEEQKKIIDEARQDYYYITIDFTKEWYADYTPEDTDEVSEIMDAFVQGLVNDLEDAYNIYLDFEYYGASQEDYFSTPLTLDEAELAKEALQGEYLDVYVKKNDIFQNGDE
jgi:hypothetical protein